MRIVGLWEAKVAFTGNAERVRQSKKQPQDVFIHDLGKTEHQESEKHKTKQVH